MAVCVLPDDDKSRLLVREIVSSITKDRRGEEHRCECVGDNFFLLNVSRISERMNHAGKHELRARKQYVNKENAYKNTY